MPDPGALTNDPEVTRGAAVPEFQAQEDARPYSAPIAGGAIACQFCGHGRFRRSRFLLSDVQELLLLRYPVRCMRCYQRQYSYLMTAALAYESKSPGSSVARGADTWQAWTSSQQEEQALQRPLTTSIGPRATKLQPMPRAHTAPLPPSREDDRQIW